MSDDDEPRADSSRTDPLGDVINLVAAPLASAMRTVEQYRRGVDEMFRAIDNLNTTLENLNEAAGRLNRLMGDVEEPVRMMIPQLTRTVKAADEMMSALSGPAAKVAPSVERIADTLGSPAFTALPHRLEEFVSTFSELSRRLTPLTQLAESAGGMFGVRLPGFPARPPEPAAPPPEPVVTLTPKKRAAPKSNAASKTTATPPRKRPTR
jgi:ABC-type transporter Mla subunit MlaD